MKKRIYLLITLILSLFIFSGRVEAAKELTCVYDDGKGYYKMIVQDTNGNLELYFWNNNKEKIKSINDAFWTKHSEYSDNEITFKYNDKEGVLNLTECPDYSSTYHITKTKEFEFYDETKLIRDEDDLLSDFSCNCMPSLDKHKEWLAKCSYGDSEKGYTDLYFSETYYEIKTNRHGFSGAKGSFNIDDVTDMYEVGKFCPSVLWEYYYDAKSTGMPDILEYYLVKPSLTIEGISCTNSGSSCTTLTKLNYEGDKSEYYEETDNNVQDDVELDNCEVLLGDDLYDWINELMDYVKIFVPILLIGLGIFDFIKALFSGSEDDMKKSQSKFFKRIVAALLIFISPMIINLFLKLANEVWSFINPNTCIR